MSEQACETEQHWRRISRRTVYSGRVRIALHDVQLPSGTRSTFEVDESIPFAVAVLVHERISDSLLCARQYRYAIDRWIFDLPGGAGERGEAPGRAAARECEEELGLVPDSLTALYTFYPNPGRSAWPVHLFFAEAAHAGIADRGDEAEQVELARLNVTEVDALIAGGAIVDPSLLIARAIAAVRGLLPPVRA